MNNLFEIIDVVLFVIFFLQITYLFFFALFSLRRPQTDYPPARKQHRFLILFPAYREDLVIMQTIDSFLRQTYPKERYDVIVVSDQMQQETNEKLSAYPLTLLKTENPLGSKAAALNYAIANLKNEYDCIVILDADNIVEATFLERINDVYDFGVYAIQAHRKAKNKNTDIAVLDAVSEEINNSIFRKGHINAGLSSALIGSGMAIDYPWFVQNIKKVSSAGEDKELELLLLSQGVYIEYLDSVIVYDEKTPGSSSFYQQRRRWLGAQFFLLKKGLSSFPQALFSGNINYVDKLFQWLLFPRILLLGISFGLACITLMVDYTLSFKWWGILVLLFITLSIAMPDELYDESFKRALKRVPILFILMLLNLFRTKGAGRNFIHTKHGGENV